MQIIEVSSWEGIEKAKIKTVICREDEDPDEVFWGGGLQIKNGEWQPRCWICGESDSIMIRLKNIDDDCMDEYLCPTCIKKLPLLIEE